MFSWDMQGLIQSNERFSKYYSLEQKIKDINKEFENPLLNDADYMQALQMEYSLLVQEE